MTVSLNAKAWRMLRRMLQTHPKVRTFREIRNWCRHTTDLKSLDGFVADELVVAGKETADFNDRTYRLTKKGVEACDLGEYQR